MAEGAGKKAPGWRDIGGSETKTGWRMRGWCKRDLGAGTPSQEAGLCSPSCGSPEVLREPGKAGERPLRGLC